MKQVEKYYMHINTGSVDTKKGWGRFFNKGVRDGYIQEVEKNDGEDAETNGFGEWKDV